MFSGGVQQETVLRMEIGGKQAGYRVVFLSFILHFPENMHVPHSV